MWRSVISGVMMLILLNITVNGGWLLNSLPPLPAIPTTALNSINSQVLREHLSYLADPALGGRYSFSSGHRLAAQYLAAHLKTYGFRGGAKDGSFFQRILMSNKRVDEFATLLQLNPIIGMSEKFDYAADFYLEELQDVDLTAPLVVWNEDLARRERATKNSPAANNTTINSAANNDTSVDLAGKIVFVNRTKNVAIDQGLVRSFAEQGAVAVLTLALKSTIANWSIPERVPLEEKEIFNTWEIVPPIAAQPTMPVIEISPRLAENILTVVPWVGLESTPKKKQTFNLPITNPLELPVSVNLRIAISETQQRTQNVVGIYDGGETPQEYVLLSAHYDHLKTADNKVYCGADDDGSGVAAILAIAQALAQNKRPRRSILIVFHTAEEIGLVGSHYFTNTEPLVPLNLIVTALNVDMIGRSRPAGKADTSKQQLTDQGSLYIIGSNKRSRELHQLHEQTNRDTIHFRLDYSYNDENHPQQLYYRSDHYNYAQQGIPIIFYFTGFHGDYHQSTDTIEKIDFDKLLRITRLVYATAWRIASLDHRVKHDKPAINAKSK
jgi:Peptidase family M28